jgi:flagellar secretion chaperone FliS
MLKNNAYSQYKENAVFTASPEELTLMLYNGLVKFIMQAQKAIEEKDLQKAHNSIVRAEDIISEFQATLDKRYEISNSLSLIYDYMNRRLVEANIKKDKDILEEVIYFAKELRDTWAQAIKIAKQQGGEQKVAR